MDSTTDLPAHLTAAQAFEYIKSYAAHFDLNRDVRLNTSVEHIKRNADDTKWEVTVKCGDEQQTKDFDRLVMCSGLVTKAVTPQFEGIEKFKGRVLHVQAFKRYVSTLW